MSNMQITPHQLQLKTKTPQNNPQAISNYQQHPIQPHLQINTI